MSVPVDQQQQQLQQQQQQQQQQQPQQQQEQQLPPPLALSQQVYTSHSHHGSIGTVIAVLTVITVLGLIAGMIGRICSGRRVRGLGQYDFESWVERKCSSCIDGRITTPLPPSISSIDSVPVAIPVDLPQKEEDPHNPSSPTKS